MTKKELPTEIKGKQEGIPGAETAEERQEIAHKLLSMIDDADIAKGSLPERWEAVEKLYNLEGYERSYMPHEGAAEFAFPLMSARLDAMEASVCNAILASSPYFTAKSSGIGAMNTDVVEKGVQWALDMALFPEKLREGAHIAATTGRVIFRLWFDARIKGFGANMPDLQSYEQGEVECAAPRLDVIHPQDFVIYPPTCKKITGSRLVGHFDYMRRQEIQEAQRGESWYCGGDLAEASVVERAGKSATFAKTTAAGTSLHEDNPVKVYFLQVKLDLDADGSEEWYECILAYDTCELLDIAPYEWSRPGYFAPGFHTEYKTFYPANSPGKKLEQLSLAYNELLNLYFDAAEHGAFPTTFANLDSPGMLGGGDQYLKVAPGTIVGTNGQPQVVQISAAANLQTFPEILAKLEDLADQAVRRPITSIGGQFQPGTTATAANQSAAAMGESQNEMLNAFAGNDLCSMADFALEIITRNSMVIKEVYGDSAPWQSEEELAIKCLWEVSGKSLSSNGQYVMQTIQMVAGLITQLGFGRRIDEEGITEAIVQAAKLPTGAKILKTEEELLLEQQQQQQELAAMGAGVGLSPDGLMGGDQVLPAGAPF